MLGAQLWLFKGAFVLLKPSRCASCVSPDHVEKFAHSSHWQLVHQWLGADLDQKLGLSEPQWEAFVGQLDSLEQQLLSLKRANLSDFEMALALKITPKQVQKRWSHLLEMASLVRNKAPESSNNRINHSIAA